jgi:hypothetical protein
VPTPDAVPTPVHDADLTITGAPQVDSTRRSLEPLLSPDVSDFDPQDGRPEVPLVPCTVDEAVYVFHDAGLVGLEVGTFGIDGRNPETSVVLGLTIDQARYVALY